MTRPKPRDDDEYNRLEQAWRVKIHEVMRLEDTMSMWESNDLVDLHKTHQAVKLAKQEADEAWDLVDKRRDELFPLLGPEE